MSRRTWKTSVNISESQCLPSSVCLTVTASQVPAPPRAGPQGPGTSRIRVRHFAVAPRTRRLLRRSPSCHLLNLVGALEPRANTYATRSALANQHWSPSD
jgi:hypothetical protein